MRLSEFNLPEKALHLLIIEDPKSFYLKALGKEKINIIKVYSELNLKEYGRSDIIVLSSHIDECIDYELDEKGENEMEVLKHSKTFHVDIFELKNRDLVSEDFDQVARYKTAIRLIIKNSFEDKKPNIHDAFGGGSFGSLHIKSYLVGTGIKTGHFISNFSDINVITYEYSLLDGIKFKKQDGWWGRTGCDGIDYKSLSI